MKTEVKTIFLVLGPIFSKKKKKKGTDIYPKRLELLNLLKILRARPEYQPSAYTHSHKAGTKFGNKSPVILVCPIFKKS